MGQGLQRARAAARATRQDEAIRILNAGQQGGIVDELARAEEELTALSEQTRAAYRTYLALDTEQTVKANEVKELRLRLRELAEGGR
jgi:hypothetical protein